MIDIKKLFPLLPQIAFKNVSLLLRCYLFKRSKIAVSEPILIIHLILDLGSIVPVESITLKLFEHFPFCNTALDTTYALEILKFKRR